MLLIETAAEALSILADEAPSDVDTDQFVRERAMSFRELAARYFSLVNVQLLCVCVYARVKLIMSLGYSIRSKKPYSISDKRSQHCILSQQDYTL